MKKSRYKNYSEFFELPGLTGLRLSLNRIPVMAPILAPLLGFLFNGGISPSKIGLIAPY
jgi:hypothetical protein